MMKIKDKPYMTNYPELYDWVNEHEGRCTWQLPLGNEDEPTAFVEHWRFPNGAAAIITVQANQNGWSIFPEIQTMQTKQCLDEAALCMGLTDEME
jgi:hypothetical protein